MEENYIYKINEKLNEIKNNHIEKIKSIGEKSVKNLNFLKKAFESDNIKEIITVKKDKVVKNIDDNLTKITELLNKNEITKSKEEISRILEDLENLVINQTLINVENENSDSYLKRKNAKEEEGWDYLSDLILKIPTSKNTDEVYRQFNIKTPFDNTKCSMNFENGNINVMTLNKGWFNNSYNKIISFLDEPLAYSIKNNNVAALKELIDFYEACIKLIKEFVNLNDKDFKLKKYNIYSDKISELNSDFNKEWHNKLSKHKLGKLEEYKRCFSELCCLIRFSEYFRVGSKTLCKKSIENIESMIKYWTKLLKQRNEIPADILENSKAGLLFGKVFSDGKSSNKEYKLNSNGRYTLARDSSLSGGNNGTKGGKYYTQKALNSYVSGKDLIDMFNKQEYDFFKDQLPKIIKEESKEIIDKFKKQFNNYKKYYNVIQLNDCLKFEDKRKGKQKKSYEYLKDKQNVITIKDSFGLNFPIQTKGGILIKQPWFYIKFNDTKTTDIQNANIQCSFSFNFTDFKSNELDENSILYDLEFFKQRNDEVSVNNTMINKLKPEFMEKVREFKTNNSQELEIIKKVRKKTAKLILNTRSNFFNKLSEFINNN